MKLFVSIFNIVFLILFMISTPAFSGQLHMWVDENGVTHMTSQPPPADSDSETIKYKKRKNTRAPSRDNLDYIRMKEAERDDRIKRQMKSERIDREIKRDREKRKQEREFDKAKREYEYHKKKRKSYKEDYHDAHSYSVRKYYRNKLREADEARSTYFRLKNKYGDPD